MSPISLAPLYHAGSSYLMDPMTFIDSKANTSLIDEDLAHQLGHGLVPLLPY